VVFDCCHSASTTRADGEGVRGAVLSATQNGPTYIGATQNKFHYTSMASHVLLAACGEREKAREEDNHGVFTKRLVAQLRKYGLTSLSYVDLISTVGQIAEFVIFSLKHTLLLM